MSYKLQIIDELLKNKSLTIKEIIYKISFDHRNNPKIGSKDLDIENNLKSDLENLKNENKITIQKNKVKLKEEELRNGMRLVKVNSHRASAKLKLLLNNRNLDCYYSFYRSGYWYAITPEEMEILKINKITGVCPAFWKEDIHKCWT